MAQRTKRRREQEIAILLALQRRGLLQPNLKRQGAYHGNISGVYRTGGKYTSRQAQRDVELGKKTVKQVGMAAALALAGYGSYKLGKSSGLFMALGLQAEKANLKMARALGFIKKTKKRKVSKKKVSKKKKKVSKKKKLVKKFLGMDLSKPAIKAKLKKTAYAAGGVAGGIIVSQVISERRFAKRAINITKPKASDNLLDIGAMRKEAKKKKEITDSDVKKVYNRTTKKLGWSLKRTRLAMEQGRFN